MEIKCTICGIIKEETFFYKNEYMPSGYANQCKECVKSRAKKRYEDLSNDESWMDKERLRGRLKYKKLYSEIRYNSKKPAICRSTRRFAKLRFDLLRTQELHHWNYNYPKSFYILNIRHHHKIHKYLQYDDSSKCFYYNGLLLDSIEKHTNALIDISNILKIDIDIIIYDQQ